MRRIRLDNLVRRAARMMDQVDHRLICVPTGPRLVGRVLIERSEAGPPLGFEPGFEVARIRRADDVTAHPFGVLDDKDAPRAEYDVGRSVDMPDQPWIPIEPRGIVAAGARR